MLKGSGAVNLFGFLAAGFSLILWLPQARVVWRQRRNPAALAGISKGTLGLVIANTSCWIPYAYLTGAYWSGVPSLVNLPLAIANLVIVARGRRLSTSSRPNPHDSDAPDHLTTSLQASGSKEGQRVE